MRLFDKWLARAASRSPVADIHAPLLSGEEIATLARRAHALRQLAGLREVRHRHAGDLRSAWLGSGLDFEEARPYQPGDDVRGMDWRTTARTARPHIRIYREEHQPALHLLLDRGASMRFGTRGRLKVTQAARIAALLGFAAAGSNTCIGATLWQPAMHTLPCRNGEAGAMQLAQAASTPCPPLQHAAMQPLAAVLARLDAILTRGTRVVLVSDFHALAEADGAQLLRLASRHQVQAIQVLDAAEVALPDVGLARFQDAASGAARWLATGSRTVREAYRAQAAARQAEQARLFQRVGVPLQRCMTDTDPFDLLHAIRL